MSDMTLSGERFNGHETVVECARYCRAFQGNAIGICRKHAQKKYRGSHCIFTRLNIGCWSPPAKSTSSFTWGFCFKKPTIIDGCLVYRTHRTSTWTFWVRSHMITVAYCPRRKCRSCRLAGSLVNVLCLYCIKRSIWTQRS